MEADIKLIKLSRITMEGKKNPKREGCYVADYFDLIQENAINLKNPFGEWFDIEKNDFENHEVAVQSYLLYCSAAMMTKCMVTNKHNYCADPFNEPSDGCLSIIQVYINPEILARMDSKTRQGCCHGEIILQPFVDDLYDILDKYCEKNSNDGFKARVYLMLSAGDLAIAVRSSKPDTAYRIATYVRRRIAAGEDKSKDYAYVVYKTYTVSTIKHWDIQDFEESAIDSGVGYALRGCYSNIYWKEYSQNHELGQQLNGDINEFYPISGRYDFTARLTEEEFHHVLSFIIAGKDVTNAEQSDVVQYLKFLIEKKYLSYINERYLMPQAENDISSDEDGWISTKIFLGNGTEKNKDIFSQNEGLINELLEKQEELTKSSSKIKGYRKNISQYIFLIRRAISLCRSINELSDMRIYAKILLEQLDTVLDSSKAYFDECSKADNNELIDMLEDNLRKAVFTMDSFAQYIRNNNLQSIQMPNYNIETTMGMEKILIGYSEMLRNFIEFYKNTICMSTNKSFLPVMIPNLCDSDVNVKVLFSGDNLSKICPGRKELMVITTPTLKEITNFSLMIPPLFHEIAHQLRYEERKSRNRALLRAAVQEIMNQTAKHIVNVIDEAIGEVHDDEKLIDCITDSLTEAFIETKYYGCKSSEWENKSLQQFETELYENIEKLFYSFSWNSKLMQKINEFIFELRFELNVSNEVFHEYLNGMIDSSKNIENIINGNKKDFSEQELADCFDNIINSAFMLSFECVGNYLSKKELKKLTDEAGASLELKWECIYRHNKGRQTNNSRCINRIYRAFEFFRSWIEGHEEQVWRLYDFDKKNWNNAADEIKSFGRLLYNKMQKRWEALNKKSQFVYLTNGKRILMSCPWHHGCKKVGGCLGLDYKPDLMGCPRYHYWSKVGRYLGLDYDIDGRERFLNTIKVAIRLGESELYHSVIDLYREETADLMMCNAINLDKIGYLSLSAALLVTDNEAFHGTDIERVFCVMYVQWYEDKNKWEECEDDYYSIFTDLMEKFYDAMKNVYIAPSHLKADDNTADVKGSDWHKRYIKIESEIKTINKYINSEEDNERKEGLRHVTRIYGLLKELIANGKYYWEKINKHSELLKDMRRGKSILKQLCTNENDDMYLELGINNITKAAGAVKEYLEKPYLLGIRNNNQEINQNCIELLLVMYYRNKIRIAQGSDGNTNAN